MFAHARSELPNEACGILAGKNGQVVKFLPAVNVAACPYPDDPSHRHTRTCGSPTRYVVDPQDQARFLAGVRKNDWDPDPLGIFHSHTHTPAYPSSTDVSLAVRNYPDAFYLIASLQNDPPLIRAFRVVEGQVAEEDISYPE